MNLTKQFFKYVSQNIFGLLGTSCYILADTYFISQAAGTDGVTLLNLCLPVYNFMPSSRRRETSAASAIFPMPSSAPVCSACRSCWWAFLRPAAFCG